MSVTSSTKGNWVLGVKSFFGNPYDGKTLKEALEQASSLSGAEFKECCVDLGYRGKDNHSEEIVIILPTRKKLTPVKKKMKKRRSAIEPIIGHLKSDHLMKRNRLSGKEGDEFNPVLSGAAFNLMKILKKIKEKSRTLIFDFFQQLYANFILPKYCLS